MASNDHTQSEETFELPESSSTPTRTPRSTRRKRGAFAMENTMKQEDFLLLRQEIIQRAQVLPTPTAYQIEIERLQGKNLAQFVRLRLEQLHISPRALAQALEIELDFVDALLNANFPVSQLNGAMFDELARSLRCEVNDLRQAMAVDN